MKTQNLILLLKRGKNRKGSGSMHFTEKDLEEIRQIDLLTYLRTCEPWELVHKSNNTYVTKSHDSLVISNGKWMWFSQGFGGHTALDYLIKVKGYPFVEAVKILKEQVPGVPAPTFSEKKEKKLLLPAKAANCDKVRQYLTSRCIDPRIIDYCINKGLIYESYPMSNVVFIGFDEQGVERYAAFRATDESRVMGDASGSDKGYSFRIMGSDSDTLHVFESSIDLLSYITLEMMKGKSWQEASYLSMAGVYSTNRKGRIKYPKALKNILDCQTNIRKVHLHFDNDYAGKEFANAFSILLRDDFEVINEPPPFAKDYNEYLCRIVEERRMNNVNRNDRSIAR